MKMKARAGLWLAALGFALAPPARSAVMTGNIQVPSGTGPYTISYGLAQQAATLKINIRKSSDKSIVRTLSGADIPDYALTAGPHVAEITWDGKMTGGATAPNGAYYAEIVTTGDAVPAMYAGFLPVIPSFDLNGVQKADGRNYYGFGVMKDPNSPWYNVAFMPGRTNGNNPQVKGVYRVNVDGSNLGGFADPVQPATTFDWISGATTSDGKVVLTGQTSGTLKIVNPDGTVYKEMAGNATSGLYTRGVRFAGTADAGNLVFVDVGSTGGGVNTISQLSLAGAGTGVPASTVLIPTATLALPTGAQPRTLAVAWDASNNPTTIYVSYWAPIGVAKYNKTESGWVKDPNFSWTAPVFDPTAPGPKYAFVDLSPDNKILWVGMNDDLNASVNAIVEGVDPATGQPYGGDASYNYQLLPGFNPESLAVAANGNIYVLNYNGFDTGTTANAVGLIIPPDNGSSDTTRSADFQVTADTQVRISDIQVTGITFHGATITWTTNFPSDSTVSYGTTAGAEDQTQTNPAPTTNHSISVDGLQSNTKYYFTVKSTAPGLTDGISTEASFTTGAFTISNVQVTSLSDTSAVVTFDTNEPGLGIVRYSRTSGGWNPDAPAQDARHPGEISARAYIPTAAPLSKNHSVTLTGLSPNTKYYFVAESGVTPTGSPAIFALRPTYAVDSAEASFQTLNTIQVTSTSLTATTNSATLKFTTNPAAAAVVKWGSAPDALSNSVNVPSGTDHTAELSGLAAGTAYYFTIDLSASGAASRTTPVGTLVTAIPGGTPTTVTHSTAADLKASVRSQIVLGDASGLVSLEKQGVPGIPTAGPDLPAARYYEGIVAYNGYLYSIGGNDSAGAAQPNVWVAPINSDGSFGAWTETSPLPDGRWLINNQCVAYAGYLYVLGGAGPLDPGTVVYYAKQNADGTLQAWKNTTPLPVGKDLASVVVVDGAIYLSGGETGSDDQTNDVYKAEIRADGTLGPWSNTTPLKDALYLHRSVANAHRIYTFGGLTDSTAANYNLTDVNTVDIATAQPLHALTPFLRATDDLGSVDGAMNTNRYGMGAGLLHGKLVIAGGRAADNTATTDLFFGQINADGSTGMWLPSSSGLPLPIKDNDATAYNGVFYVGTGRQATAANTATSTVVYTPFDIQPNLSGATYAYSGNLDSQVIDLGALSNLQHLKVAATGGGVEVRYRFAGEDGNFTPWFTSSSLDADISGGARYFQYQLVLSGNGSSTPVVNSVALTSAPIAPGTFTKTDVQTALKAAGGLINLSPADKTKLDLDSDGSVTVKDAVAINRKVNGL